MKIKEIISEMPIQVGPQFSNFEDFEYRKKILNMLDKENPTNITDDVEVVARNGSVIYFVRKNGDLVFIFELIKTNNPTVIISQSIWKHNSISNMKSTDFVFEVVLKDHNVIISGSEQSPDGNKFWVNLMKSAILKNFEVGFLDAKSTETKPYNGKIENLEKWIRNNEFYGSSQNFANYRFYVAKK